VVVAWSWEKTSPRQVIPLKRLLLGAAGDGVLDEMNHRCLQPDVFDGCSAAFPEGKEL